MPTIIFESHATTFDNERKIASGHFDVDLSPRGVQQAKELGERRKGEHFDAIFTSDLQRAYKTATLAFGDAFPIFQDNRLRECNYGAFEHQPSSIIEAESPNRIHIPFPGGDSYEQRATLIASLLSEIVTKHPNGRILIIGHRATQYGIEAFATGAALTQIVATPWQWQPGWTYNITAERYGITKQNMLK